MGKKLASVSLIVLLIVPFTLVLGQTINAAPTSLDSINVTKFEQVPGDDLLDNIATVNVEISADTIDFNNLHLDMMTSNSTLQDIYNYNTEEAHEQTISKTEFVNGKITLTLDIPLLFEGTNYLSCYIYDYSPYAQYTYRIYACRDFGIELTFDKIAPQIPVYRFFNTKLGTHLYTTSAIEKDGLKEEYYLNPNAEWDYEGYKFFVFKNAIAHPDAVAVHRFFNTQEGGHIYTTSEIEKNTIMNNLPKYTYEGIKFYVVANPTIGFVPVYRFFNTKTGTHLYTISESEKSTIMSTLPQYSYEGVKFHVLEN